MSEAKRVIAAAMLGHRISRAGWCSCGQLDTSLPAAIANHQADVALAALADAGLVSTG